jgi:hypothetical protein
MANDTRNQTGANPYRYVLILLFAGYLLSFADRIVFGLVLKPIKVTLALSDSQAGLLAGAAFAVAYAIFAPAGGYFIDRHPRRPILLSPSRSGVLRRFPAVWPAHSSRWGSHAQPSARAKRCCIRYPCR